RIGQRRPIQQTPQRRAIGASQRFERLVAKRTARLPKRQVGKTGNQRQRDNQRSKRRKANGKGHGGEQRRFAALQREQWEISSDDDQRRKEDRPRHLASRGPDVFLGQCFVWLRFPAAQNILGHHDGAVNDHAEIERTERKHARRHVRGIHQNKDRNDRQRNGHRDD